MDDVVYASSSQDAGIVATVLGIIGSFFILFIVIGIIWYVLAAFGFYRMAQNRHLPYAWISWIPVCQNYIMGDLIGNRLWGFGYTNWLLVAGNVLSVLLGYVTSYVDNGFVSLLILIFYIVNYVYNMSAYYKLYKIYTSKPVLFLVLSIIFPFLVAIFIFAIRDHEPKPIEDGTDV